MLEDIPAPTPPPSEPKKSVDPIRPGRPPVGLKPPP